MTKKNKIKIIISITILSIFFITTGIILHILDTGPKTALTINEFQKIAKENNLNVNTIELVDSNGNPNKDIKDAMTAKSKNGWQLEYYIIKNEKKAKNIFKETKQIYLTFKNSLTEQEKKSKENYDIFTMKTQTSFMHVARIDNTILTITANDDNEKQITRIIKKLGYK